MINKLLDPPSIETYLCTRCTANTIELKEEIAQWRREFGKTHAFHICVGCFHLYFDGIGAINPFTFYIEGDSNIDIEIEKAELHVQGLKEIRLKYMLEISLHRTGSS